VVAAAANLVLKSANEPKVDLMASARSALGLPAAALFHDLPEHGMIHVTAAVVAYGGANRFRNAIKAGQQLLDGQ